MFERFVTEQKQNQLLDKMAFLEVFQKDLQEKYVTGSGKGGQKINKVATCVYLKHLITGLEVKCQKSRYRALNRFYARKFLCEKIEELKFGKESEKQIKINKIRKQKDRKKRKKIDS